MDVADVGEDGDGIKAGDDGAECAEACACEGEVSDGGETPVPDDLAEGEGVEIADGRV